MQNYEINITITELNEQEIAEREHSGSFFQVVGDRTKLNPKQEEPVAKSNGDITATKPEEIEDDDDFMIVEAVSSDKVIAAGTKRALEVDESIPSKKRKINTTDVEVVDID